MSILTREQIEGMTQFEFESHAKVSDQILYHITIIGHIHLATGLEYMYQPVGYFRTRESAWDFLVCEFGDDALAEQNNRWEVAKIPASSLSDDEWRDVD